MIKNSKMSLVVEIIALIVIIIGAIIGTLAYDTTAFAILASLMVIFSGISFYCRVKDYVLYSICVSIIVSVAVLMIATLVLLTANVFVSVIVCVLLYLCHKKVLDKYI